MMDHEWGYPGTGGTGASRDTKAINQPVVGPEKWPKYYPVGQRQSPINIQLDSCDLHQLTCGSCGLSKQMQQELKLTKKLTSPMSLVNSQQDRRHSHLDSLGYDDDDDEEDDYDYEDDDYEDYDNDHGHDDYNRQRSPSASSDDNSSLASRSGSLSSGSDVGRTRQKDLRKQVHKQQQQRKQRDRINNRISNSSSGKQQQQLQNTLYCATNKKIFFGYPRYLSSIELSNTGHTWQINLPPELAQHTLLTGPPLGDREYRLAQLHCHWGEDCDHGSEHQINGKSFAAEIHFVHWNCSQFSSPEEASKHRHGLAVVGVLVQAFDGTEQNRNKHLDKIIAGLPQVNQPNTSTILRDSKLDLKKLLPTNRWNYATYEGSLTTPPLSEVVDWILFLQPIQCSREQIEQFRQLKCSTGQQLVKNCRPVQAHHDRNVSIWTHSHGH